jgi:hypothetical protein
VVSEWLAEESVPLWAFVLALLTSQRESSRYAVRTAARKLGAWFGAVQESDDSTGD